MLSLSYTNPLLDGNSSPRSSWQGEWPRAILPRRARLVAAGISEGGVGAERLMYR